MAKINAVHLESMLKGIKFPVRKEELIEQAEAHGADEQVMQALHQLPNHHFRTAMEVSKALGAEQNASRSSQN
ncbi:DUF2795 domain-containing protein [Tengunoibacter tsumagoiensis]|uniref:DUF2795 domain-containing protein n=1 Tax=Tengunoibacter tsumagoiensis TaxID=2014871 RepID=A0A401ZVB6_9CHLR|nr:DUF2795 domain-containing protein [Tengunoibacter tsumagoiensis]GCE10742.1 hypothetical protein KTT_06010 [Tengunoibacter tsumagoiensis]